MSLLILLITGFIYTQFQTTSIYGGDAGDLVAAAVVKGVPHPPGYPLYTATGYLLTQFTISTSAFEVGFLSSIPSAITILLIFLISKKLTKNTIASLIAALSVAFTYLYWLYSIVPEVFSLNLMFMSLLIYLLIRFDENPDKKLLYLLLLITGLSLSHHHIILFFFPAFIYFIFKTRKKFMRIITPKTILGMCLFFGVGLLPYLYLPIAAFSNPPLNWSDPITIKNFIHLVTRAEYGSFTAGQFVLNAPFARLYQFKAYARFLVTDFTLIGIVIAFLGSIYQLIKQKTYWFFLMIGFLMVGPIFLFYAAYPLSQNFSLATYERFLLPSYIFVGIWFAYGIHAFSLIIDNLFKRAIQKKSIIPLSLLTQSVFIIFPLSFFLAHYPQMSVLKNDRTAELLVSDILSTVPPHAILILAGDTSLFNTQYVYYSENPRPDIKLIHMSKLYRDYYVNDLTNQYEDLVVPSFDDEFMVNFFKANGNTFPIYSSHVVPGSGGFWVREGLLLKYYENEDSVPDADTVLKNNTDIWATYHNPLEGALSRYKHLMLYDSAKYYSDSLVDLSEALFRVSKHKDAVPFLEKALEYQSHDANIYYMLGKAYFNSDNCDGAKDMLLQSIDFNPYLIESYESLSLVYKVCYDDDEKSEYYQDLFEEKNNQIETPLESL